MTFFVTVQKNDGTWSQFFLNSKVTTERGKKAFMKKALREHFRNDVKEVEISADDNCTLNSH